MESTRASIQDTVDELREKVSDAVDWRHYVDRYPGASLGLALAVGLLVGRGVAGAIRKDGGHSADRYGYGWSARSAESFGEAALEPSAAGSAAGENRPRSAASRAVSQSWARLGSRLEGIVNRVIDELSDAVETTAVPALTERVRDLLDFGGEGSTGRARGRREESGRGQAGGTEAAASGRRPGSSMPGGRAAAEPF